MPDQPEIQVTSAAEIRRRNAAGFMVTVPSGFVLKVRRINDMLPRLQAGLIPNPLKAVIEQVMFGNTPANMQLGDMEVEAATLFLDYVDDTTLAMVLDPPVVRKPLDAPLDWEPSEGHIELQDLTLDDRMFLFHLAQGGTAEVETFREEQAKALELVSNGAGLAPAPEQPTGNPPG